MYYFMPVFLFIVTAQFCLLQIVRSTNSIKAVRRLPGSECQQLEDIIAQDLQKPDTLDWEIFLSKKHKEDIEPRFEIQGKNQFLSLFTAKRALSNQPVREEYSLIIRLLKTLLPLGVSIDKFKEYLCSLLKMQYYSGKAPDYVSEGNYIDLNGASSIFIPLAVSAYINYSGDLGFLNEKMPFNAYLKNVVGNYCPTVFSEDIYTRCLFALDSVKLNQFGLIFVPINCGLPFDIGLDNEYSDIILSICYIAVCDFFLPFVKERNERVNLVNRQNELKKNILKKLNITKGFTIGENKNKLICALLYLLSQDSEYKEEIYSQIKQFALSKDFSFEEDYISVMYAFIFALNKDTDCLLSLFKKLEDKISGETLMQCLRQIIKKYLLGITFKNGFLSVKPMTDGFELSFKYENSIVNIACDTEKFDGLNVGGLRFNNLDYILLKGYNKDINIRLGA